MKLIESFRVALLCGVIFASSLQFTQAADIEADTWLELDIWIEMDEENKYPDSYDKDLKREVTRS